MRHFKLNWASIATLAYLSSHYASAAEPAQIPLASRVAEPPIPNVTMTIDDSGSMLADFMPEGDFAVGNYTVRLAGKDQWMGGFPGDYRKLCQAGRKGAPGCSSDQYPNQTFLLAVATAVKPATNVYQKQFRSPDVNAIYYNPDVQYLPWNKADGTRYPDADAKAAAYDPVITNVKLDLTTPFLVSNYWQTNPNFRDAKTELEFNPGLVYRLKPGADPNDLNGYDDYDVNAKDGKHAAPVSHENRHDCVKGQQCTQEQELKNFANWFTYFRMRESLTKAAVSESFVEFKDKLRVSWGRINNDGGRQIDGSTEKYSVIESDARGGPMRPLDGARLATVLGGVQQYGSWGSTPLRTALDAVGSYYNRNARRNHSADPKGSPWLTDPTNSNGEKLTCRRSVSVLMTDGYYNDWSFSGIGNIDGADGPQNDNPDKYDPAKYTPTPLYSDDFENTLADTAMEYYVRDLDLTIENRVPPLVDDIAFWQHLTQFTVGLGVRGTFDTSTPAAKAATREKLRNNDLKWPNPGGDVTKEKIDDMFHAAVNTGGDFYSVRNVGELTAALKDAFGRSAGNEAKEAGVSTSSTHISEGNVKYVPRYKSISWWGDFEAWELGLDGKEKDTPKWLASNKLPKPGERNLITKGATGPVSFEWSLLDESTQTLIGPESLLNYVRGDDTNTGPGKSYRARVGKLLGDFVNTAPVYVKGNVDLGYTAIDTAYTNYVTAKKTRPDGLVFAGANDGMLHAFRASDGTELLGYLPREGLSRLKQVAAQNYGTPANYHRFFVDGPLNETDAFIRPPGAGSAQWTNLVIGSMGAGGRSIFALHVPTDFGGSLDAADLPPSSLMWEVNSGTDEDIGYIFADFAVGKIKGGGWYAFVGNGVYSKDGKAALFVVDLQTGTVKHKLVVDPSGNNGLMGVTLIKDDMTHEVLGAYAGDLKGNVWRFDFVGDDEATVAFKNTPLYQAKSAAGAAQPITAPPAMVTHPTSGRVVLFGSGRLIDAPDSDSKAPQTFYGVWDQVKIGESGKDADNKLTGREQLVPQITTTTLVAGKYGNYVTVKSTPVNWDTDMGWLMDLPFDRQRVLQAPYILGTDHVLINTSVPATEAPVCSSNPGVGYTYLLSAADGQASTTPSIDTNGDGVVDEKDDVVGGFETGNDGRDSVLDSGGEGDQDSPCVGGKKTYQVCHSGKQCQVVTVDCKEGPPEYSDRLWKHLLNPPTPK